MSDFKKTLQQQLCSVCHKYLSVAPIKVYHNRQVKCGRCTEDDDAGTESKLYSTVIKEMKFPCINSSEGCTEHFTIWEMKEHEESCKSNIYECQICEKYEGTAYELSLHCEKNHSKETLKSTDFLIDLQKGYQKGCYFYNMDEFPLFIMFTYDVQTITVDVSFTEKKYQGEFLQEWTLCSIDNEIEFNSNKIACSKISCEKEEGFEVKLSELKFYKNILCCKFRITKNPFLSIDEKVCEVNPMITSFRVTCIFNEIAKLPFEEKRFSDIPKMFYFHNISWKFFFFKKINTNKAGIYVEAEKTADSPQEVTEVVTDLKFTIISSKKHDIHNIKKPVSFNLNNDNWGYENYLLDPNNGFIKNDSITAVIQVKILSPKIKQVEERCTNCSIHCKNQ